MKKSFVFIFLGSFVLVSCGNNGNGSSKEVNIYFDEKNEPSKIKVRFFNDNKEIPYITIDESCKIEGSKPNLQSYPTKNNDSVFTIENPYNQSTMTINGETGEVIYKDFYQFQTRYKYDDGDYIEEFRDASSDKDKYINKKVSEQSKYTACSEYKLNLSDFNLKPIKYDNSYYLPISIVQELLCYSNGAYYFDNNDNIYYIEDEGGYHKTLSPRNSYSKTFYEYCFNEFSLNTEICYGLKGLSRNMRSASTPTVHNYFPNGVVKEFESYKQDIINSSNVKDFDNKLNSMINKTIDDGGHTYGSVGSFGNDREKDLENSDEIKFYNNLSDTYKKLRKESKDKDSINNFVSVYDTDSDGKYDIGYLTFNDFSDKTDTKKGETNIREIFRDKNANSMLNPKASGYDSTKYDIKDVIVDVSGNGGGSVKAQGFILSWICGGYAQESIKTTNGKGFSSYTYQFDVDGDGKYSESDYLPTTVNVYILFSGVTYSAANSFVFNSSLYNKKQGARKIQFMGSTSGGGACSVTGTKYLSSGFTYRLSYNGVNVDPDDTTKNSENGVSPDTGLSLTYEQMVDRTGTNGINQLVTKRRK